MFTSDQEARLRQIISSSLDRAELHWKNGGHLLVARAAFDSAEMMSESLESERSHIPGHPIIREDETIIDDFIAFVADMRNSTNHLLTAISPKKADVSTLQRVFYETSALLPSLAYTVKLNEGNVTEYLGDGVLALFKVDQDSPSSAIYSAHDSAKKAIGPMRDILNEILRKRYRLPEIDLGVGLAYSKAIVSLVGLPRERHPKVFGECVYRATKLSGGINEVCVDDKVRAIWPTSKNGLISFRTKIFKDVPGHIVYRKKE
ncbi:adenylate/guanylate cyclase [Ectopseudomonas guguanensis]|uniref:adenylate/guanylate cyclase n=1 Tax=Ectopseudomonas guguanensis TaxID=1198456 RepID=UPI000A4EC014|nr:adenylate/guanylate cyclase [Pseudomonas guguanensis]